MLCKCVMRIPFGPMAHPSTGTLRPSLFQTGTGHANLNWRQRTNRASRFSYQVFVGPIVEGNYVCPKCDEPTCINPGHLFQGTPHDNVQAAIAKGRFRASRAEANQPIKKEETVMNDKVEAIPEEAMRFADLWFHLQELKKKMRRQFIEDFK